DSSDKVTAANDFVSDNGGVVDLEVAPNGDLAYIQIGASGQDPSVRRLAYVPNNGRAVARASANPTSGDPPLQVSFKGSDSSDPDRDPLTYDWDFGDGSAHSTQADPTHTYNTPGGYTATLTVDDGTQRYSTATVDITVNGNRPPQATVLAPAQD